MSNNILNNISYPKPNIDAFYDTYEFEISLMESVANGKTSTALNIYENFWNKKTIYNIIDSKDIQYLKDYIISITLLICHNVIKKGVSPYSGKAKYHAFSKLIAKVSSKAEVINIGKIMIQAYCKLAIHNSNSIDNIYIRKSIDYIHDNLGEDLTLDAVSSHVGLSKCYFCTKFKTETNMSFTDYLTYTRIEKSKYLLSNSNRAILDIAILIGFNSQSYFTHQFKKHTGFSPKEFRDSNSRDNYLFISDDSPSFS